MAIPARPSGQDPQSQLLWQISKQLEYLTKVTGNTGSSTDKEFVVTTYTVKTAFTGANVGDIITSTQVIDVTTNIPVTITTIWRNQTTSTDLASIPNFSNLSLEGTTALTDAQLRASAVLISATTLPLPTNASTETKQDLGNTSLDNIDNKTPALIDGATPISDNGKSITVDSFSDRLREAFQTFPNTNWIVPKQGAGDIIAIEGNAGGASYLSISLDPLTANTETWVESVGRFKMPADLSFGAHMSQRTVGQEVSMEFVSDEPIIPLFSDIAIASIQQSTTTLTVTTSQEHGLKVGNRIGIRGVVDSRLNYPSLVIATTPTLTSFTVTAGPAGTIPSITASSTGGFIYARSAMGGSPNGTSMLFENNSHSNASFYAKSESGDSMSIGGTITGNHSMGINSSSST